jgi:hypothetical protein
VLEAGRPGRLLWNDRATVVLFVLAVLVTVGIIAFQLDLRRGEFDPTLLRIYYRLYLFQDYPASAVLVGALVLAMLPPTQTAAVHLGRRLAERPWLSAFTTFAVLLVLARFIYLAHPLAMDESVPVMQSEVFGAGRVLGQLPPELIDWLIFPSFQGHFIKVDSTTGQIASSYWPGFALLLTPFSLLGISWALNPLLGGIGVYLVHSLALRLTGSRMNAGFAVLVTIGSAAFVVNAISFYSMTAHFVCNAAFVLLLLRPTAARAFGAGLIGGLALTLHNPLPHLLFGAPWLVWLACRKDRWRTLSALLTGYLPWVVICGVGWFLLQRSLEGTAGPPGAVTGGVVQHVMGLVQSILRPPNAGVLYARFIDLTKLWIWAAPALLALAAIGLWIRRREMPFVLLAASGLLTLAGYLFVPVDQGHGWGHRYFHSAWFVLPLLAAGIVRGASENEVMTGSGDPKGIVRFGMAGALAGAMLVVPYFLFQVHGFISDHLAQLPQAKHGTARVIVINPYGGYYSQDLAQNDPFLRDPVIRMVTRGRQTDRDMIARHFPDLVLLERGHRGWVWGYPEGALPEMQSQIGGVASDDQREQE